MQKRISWFEVPVKDMERARRFYETVLEAKHLDRHVDPHHSSVFPYDREGWATGGALLGADEQVMQNGAIVYLNAGESIEAVLARTEPAGGKVSLPRTELPEGLGFIALITDTEGNCVGVHAMK